MTLTHARHSSALLHALALVSALALLAGCDAFGSDDADDPDAAGSVLVANQGNFEDANGSVTSYDPQADEATEAVPPSQLGSIIQGALAKDGRYYVVANGATRLNIYDSETLDGIGQSASLGGSPRYVAVTGGETAYLTNQKYGPAASNVLLLDVSDPAGGVPVTDSIAVAGLPADVTLTGERAYTPLGGFSDTTLVAAIDRSRREVIENIQINCSARFAFTDDEGEVLLPCNDADGGEVVVLDGESGNERARISLPGAVTSIGATQAASYAPGSEELYVALSENRIARLDTDGTGDDNERVETLSISGSNPIGAVGYDAAAGELYVGRAASAENPYTQRGSVTIHRRDGSQVGRFDAGNAPAFLSFVEE